MKINRSTASDQKLLWFAIALGSAVAFSVAAYALRRSRRLPMEPIFPNGIPPGAQRRPVPLFAELPTLPVSIEEQLPGTVSPLIPSSSAADLGHSSSVALHREGHRFLAVDEPRPPATTWPRAISGTPTHRKTFGKRAGRHDRLSSRAIATGIAGLVTTAALCFAALGKLHSPLQNSAPAPTRMETTETFLADQPNRTPLSRAGGADTEAMKQMTPTDNQGSVVTTEGQATSSENVAPAKHHSSHRRRFHRTPTFAQKTRAFLRKIF